MEAASLHRRPAPRLRRPGAGTADAQLVSRVAAGDERAFELVYDRYHLPLLSFCRHMLGSREEAEDALQHVFVSAHRHLSEGRRDVDLRPWLYAIARNRCLSMLRSRRDQVALDDVVEPSTAGLAVSGQVEQREDLKELLADLARLPDEQRAALVLSELDALSHDEIAEVLGVRREKVKALVFQARESLGGWRQARSADCSEIREQLATLRGGALRRGPLRKHLDTCENCRAFRSEVRHQREAMALLLPVVPTVALKAKVFGAVASAQAVGHAAAGGLAGSAGLAGTAGAGGSASGGAAAAVGGGMLAKAAVVVAVAGLAGGGYEVAHQQSSPAVHAPPAGRVAPATPRGHSGSGPGATGPDGVTVPGTPGGSASSHRARAHHAGRRGHGHGQQHVRPASGAGTGMHPARPGHPAHPGHRASPGRTTAASAPGHVKASRTTRGKPAHPVQPVRPAHPVAPARPAPPPASTDSTTTSSTTDDTATTGRKGDGSRSSGGGLLAPRTQVDIPPIS